MLEFEMKIWKTLSRNDTGETSSHQSGISIPKEIANSGIFPKLNNKTLNPRASIVFYDENNCIHTFQYIYYNDIYFREDKKKGHNEFRITCVKDYIRENNIKAGDKIWFSIDKNGVNRIGFEHLDNNEKANEDNEKVVLVLKGGWKYVKY